jgi:hypothetical protein
MEKQKPPRVIPWILFLVTAIVYLSFLTKVNYWDTIDFAQAIEDAPGLNASLVHPNHVIYNFVGYLFYSLLRTLGFELRAVTALQILGCFFGAACAGVVFLILRDSLRSLYISICLALLYAFSATWWKFATDGNAYVPSVLFLVVAYYSVLPDRKPRPFLLALTFFAGMCFHQLAILAYPALALGIYLQDGSLPVRNRLRNVGYFTITAVVLIVASYCFFFYLATGTLNLAGLMRWTAHYQPDAEFGFNIWSNLLYTLRGHVRLFFGGRFNLLKDIANPFIVALVVCLFVAALLLVIEILRYPPKINFLRVRQMRLEQKEKTLVLVSVLWMASYVLFLFVWLPQNTFYRLFYLHCLVLLTGLALSVFEKRSSTRPGFRLALFVTALTLANFLFLIYPFSHISKYPPLAFAMEMNQHWPQGTVVFYGIDNSDVRLFRYFNPATRWRRLDFGSTVHLEQELNNAYAKGETVWLETTALDQLAAQPQGARWLEAHARNDSLKELISSAYRIRFVQVMPASDDIF